MRRTFVDILASVTIAATLLAGCGAEKKSESPLPLKALPKDAPRNSISYRLDSVDTKQTVTASVALTKSSTQFLAVNPLIVPASVPNDIGFDATLYDTSIKKSATYWASGSLRKNGSVLRNIPDAAFVTINRDGMLEIQFSVNDLKTLLSDKERSSVEILLSIFDREGDPKKATFELLFELQTPPSKLGSAFYMPPSTYEIEKKVIIPQKYKVISMPNGEALELIGLIELRNEDGQTYDIHVPTTFTHEFNLIKSIRSVSTSECSYSVAESISKAKLDSRIRLLTFGKRVEQILSLPPDSRYAVSLEKSGITQLGLYSSRQAALSTPKANLQYQTVPIRCMARCNDGAEGDWADRGKWGDSCITCGQAQGNAGESCFQCMRAHSPWCRWQRWSAWKDYTTAPNGTSYQLELIPESQGQFSEFFIANKFQPSAGRNLRILAKPVGIAN